MRYLKTLLHLFVAASTFAATKPVTYNPDDGKVVQPANFAAANNLARVPDGNALAWFNSLRRDFYIYVDMTPTPRDADAFDTTTTAQTNPFYYEKTSGFTYTTFSGSMAGTDIEFAYPNGWVRAANGVPSTYDSTKFTVSTALVAHYYGYPRYEKTTGMTFARTATTNSSGTAITSYNTVDKIPAVRWWTDIEIKAVSVSTGEIKLFWTTNNLSAWRLSYPTEASKSVYGGTFYVFGTMQYNGCFGQKFQFSGNLNSSIGASYSGEAVGGIWFYPDLSNAYVRSVLEDPDTVIIVQRMTITARERYNGRNLWRPAQLTYYGDFKQ